MVKITHVITGLGLGGAEMMLYKLLASMDQSQYKTSVISLSDKGVMGGEIEGLGIPVYGLGMKQSTISIRNIRHLSALGRLLMPDIVQGWMYHGNAAAYWLKKTVNASPLLLWNIRQSLYRLRDEKLLTQILIRWGAYVSDRADRIIYNSKTSMSQHEAIGYCCKNKSLIPNGFYTDIFKPDDSARLSVRNELGLKSATLIVGFIARFHPMKDHENFIKAASYVYDRRPDIHFLLAGKDVSINNPVIKGFISNTRLRSNIHLLGERRDIPKIVSSLDLAVSASSRGEGFANSIGEAMSCGVPCVVTDVGDSAWVLGNNGAVVPPKDPEALAQGVISIFEMGKNARKEIAVRARGRIMQDFDIKNIASTYKLLYEQVLAKRSTYSESLG